MSPAACFSPQASPKDFGHSLPCARLRIDAQRFHKAGEFLPFHRALAAQRIERQLGMLGLNSFCNVSVNMLKSGRAFANVMEG